MCQEVFNAHNKSNPSLPERVHSTLIVSLKLQIEYLVHHGQVVLIALSSAYQFIQLVDYLGGRVSRFVGE